MSGTPAHGSPSENRNNHPHIGTDGLFLVHNGIVSNHREVADKFALHIESDCDSEVFSSHTKPIFPFFALAGRNISPNLHSTSVCSVILSTDPKLADEVH